MAEMDKDKVAVTNFGNPRKTGYQRYAKPPYSYAGMIILCIQKSPERRLTLSQIHGALASLFPFFRDGNYLGWKDSVRHNLSQNKCFRKVLKDPKRSNAKGNYWSVDWSFVSPDIFLRQETNVAKGGNWAADLHQQLGIKAFKLDDTNNGIPKAVSHRFQERLGPDHIRTSSPLLSSSNRNSKRKIQADDKENHPTEPRSKKQKTSSFSISSILRLRSHINAKISNVKKTKSSEIIRPDVHSLIPAHRNNAVADRLDQNTYSLLHQVPLPKQDMPRPTAAKELPNIPDSHETVYHNSFESHNVLPSYQDFTHALEPSLHVYHATMHNAHRQVEHISCSQKPSVHLNNGNNDMAYTANVYNTDVPFRDPNVFDQAHNSYFRQNLLPKTNYPRGRNLYDIPGFCELYGPESLI